MEGWRTGQDEVQRCWCWPFGRYGCGLSLLVLEDPLLMNEFGRDDGRPPLGSCIGGRRSIGCQSVLGLCICMFCMFCTFAGIRGCGEWIAPREGCDADCGVPAPGPPGGG